MSKPTKLLALLMALSVHITGLATETYNYSCNGNKIKVAFPNSNSAIMLYEGDLYLLSSVVSASGARYLGDVWQLWAAKDAISLTKLTKQQTVKDDVAVGNEIECKEE